MENPTFRDAVDNCRYCFMCRHAGTAFRATKRDALTARGRALQLSLVLEGFSKWTPETAEIAYQDPIDGLCRELCAFHWPEDELQRESRKMIVAEGLAPQSVKAALEEMQELRPTDWQAGADRTGASSDVLYLTGWAARRYATNVIDAQMRVLDAGYSKVRMLGDETGSAAAAAYDLGHTDVAVKLSEELAKLVEDSGAKTIVTGCSQTLRVLRGETGGRDLSQTLKVVHFVEAVDELMIDGRLKIKSVSLSGALGIHDAEHLARTFGLSEVPRKIMCQVSMEPLVEFEHHGPSAESAGGGAALFLTHPELSAQIARTRKNQAMDAGIEKIITSCPHCYIALSMADDGPAVVDIAELIVQASGL